MTPPAALDLSPEAASRGDATAADYLALMKPSVMRLVLFTGLVGMALAPQSLHPVMALAALLFMAMGAGASGALNMWWERDIDALMERTRERPIPQGRMEAGEALGFGATLAIASVTAMGLFINLLAAALLALTIAFYLFIYTMWLKRLTPRNIVIGGAAGALPPVIGWAAATESLALEPLALFLIIFLWTPPHFWALALTRKEEYALAQIPMLPNASGDRVCALHILIYSGLLAIASFAPAFLGSAGALYIAAAIILNALFLARSIALLRAVKGEALRDIKDKKARALFLFSILYLFLLFAALLADRFFDGFLFLMGVIA